MRRGHDTVVALFSRRGDPDATVRADMDGTTGEERASRSRLIPLAMIAVLSTLYGGLGAYWLVTGAPPAFLAPSGQRVKLEIPTRSGPESRQSALLRPPGSDSLPPPETPAVTPAEPHPMAPSVPAGPISASESADSPVNPPPVVIPMIPAGPSPTPQLAGLPPPKATQPLAPAPLPALVQTTPKGPLPIIAPDGRTSWQTYARPVTNAGAQARIAVIVSGLGLAKAVTEAAITRLPADITLSFSPYAKDLDAWLKRARAAGHEVLLDLPLEASRFPEQDPGPMALLQSLSDDKLKERLEAVMTKGTGYVGLLASATSPFTTSGRIKLVLEDARKRGLLYVGALASLSEDPNTHPAFAAVTMVLDGLPFRAAIDARLAQSVDRAKARGKAVVVMHALPVALDRLVAWMAGLGEVVVVPVSALATPPLSASAPKEPS